MTPAGDLGSQGDVRDEVPNEDVSHPIGVTREEPRRQAAKGNSRAVGADRGPAPTRVTADDVGEAMAAVRQTPTDVETAIDFKETKGPTLIWTYAVGGAALGGTLNDLRLVSVLFFVAGIAPLLTSCAYCCAATTCGC